MIAMKSSNRRQKLNLLVGLTCFAFQQTTAIAQAPAVTTRSNNSFDSVGHQVQLGLPTVAHSTSANDPFPGSPWDRQPQPAFANPIASTNPAYQPGYNATATGFQSANGLQNNVPTRSPQFIEQPFTGTRSSNQNYEALPAQSPTLGQPAATPGSSQPPFEINAPLSSIQQPSAFRMASNAQQIEAAVSQPSNNFQHQNWNTVPPHGIALNNQYSIAQPSTTNAHSTNAPALQSTQPVNQQVVPASQQSTSVENSKVVAKVASNSQPTNQSLEANHRKVVAQQVSQRLLATSDRKGPAPKPIEPPRGWNAIHEELVTHYRNCDELLRRGAIQSAREESLTGLRALCRALDSRESDRYSETALDRAMTALYEERDFYGSHSATPGDSMIAGHSTPVLKNQTLSNVAPLVAAQHYRAYARYQLVCASQGLSWAADLCYALGKTYEAQAESETTLATMYREQAIACYQAALTIKNNHGEAANQLGYSLLKVDRPSEAQIALATAVSVSPSPQAWKNLAEVYRRNGDLQNANQAVQQAVALESNIPKMNNGKPMPEVVELQPEQFAQLSPNLMSSSNPNWSPNVNQYANAATLNRSVQVAPAITAPTEPQVKTSKLDAIKNFFR